MSAATAITTDQAASILRRCRQDPEWYVREILGDNPWRRQVEIMESVRDNRQTAVPSCHSSGKTFIAARIALWFGTCFPGSKVITTAPTERQIEGAMWGEIHRARRNSKIPLGGDPTVLRIKFEEDWWIWGFTSKDYDPNRFQGFHAPHVLIVIDEAGGISKAISDQIASLMIGPHPRMLQIGNPIESGTPFEEACKGNFAHVLPISAFDTPNFTKFGITEKDFPEDIREYDEAIWQEKLGESSMPVPDLVDPHWVAERYQVWGPRSNSYKSRVLGHFPEAIEGAYYGQELQRAKEEDRIRVVPHDPSCPIVTAWDIGMRASTAIWFVQVKGSIPYFIRYYENVNQGLPHYAAYLHELREKQRYTYIDHIAPHDMREREWGAGATSRLQMAADHGIHFRVLPQINYREGSEVNNRIDAGRSLLARAVFDEDNCKDGLEALRNYRRMRNPRTGELKDHPENDWASHGADAFGYMAIGLITAKRTTRPRPNTRWVR